MSNIFNLNRFGLLLKRQWLDFGKVYLLTLVILVAVIFSFYCYFIPSPIGDNFDYDGNLDMRFRYGLFIFLGFLFISITSSSYFSILGQKPRAIQELMLPASTFEKFAGALFYTAFLAVISYLLIFYIIDLGFVKYVNSHLSEFKMESAKHSHLNGVESISKQVTSDKNYLTYLSSYFPIPFLVISIFLLGSVYFNRFHYIKTAISVAIFSAITFYMIYKASILFIGDKVMRNVMVQKDEILLWIFLVSAAITLSLWLITYIRLKEKEV
ncbi:hypothetical protein GJU39_15715 [Pedobacter petrophilus]|uniref:ABC transporter permease n=1 Tax=Pedobacter petrophilus TaxID=1908241 RepID=A0A7K0G2C8_9SPHI|nr:hypothetical protein [Pedobacter petrophilus]MRX77534.1 hypothetical protein [Pedobacter petrophilus]